MEALQDLPQASGIIVAKTRERPDDGGYCFLLYSQSEHRLIRPVSQPAAPFWPAEKGELQVGDEVTLTMEDAVDATANDAVTPHEREDRVCADIVVKGERVEDLMQLLLSKGQERGNSAVISNTIAKAWPERGENVRGVRSPKLVRAAVNRNNGNIEPVPSCIVVRGRVTRMVRTAEDGADRVRASVLDIDDTRRTVGERIDRLAVTATDILQAGRPRLVP